MTNLFKKIHLIITNKVALITFTLVDPFKEALLYFLFISFLSISLTSFLRTSHIIQKSPSILSTMFHGITIEEGTLRSETGSFSVPFWQIRKIMQVVSGQTIKTTIEDSENWVMVDSSSNKIIDTTKTALLLGKEQLVIKAPMQPLREISWNELVPTKDSFSFSEQTLSTLFKTGAISVYLLSFMLISIDSFLKLIYISLALVIMIIIFTRKLPHLFQPKIVTKMLLYSMTPYFILMPTWAVVGTYGEFLADISIIVSVIILSRALGFHKIQLEVEK